MSYVPEHIVQEIRSRIDILDIIGQHLSLKKKGQNYWACCPFHNENTPSFSVAPIKNLYKCFSCGKSGDGISFLMDIENINYGEALHKLADKYHIEIPEIELNQEQKQAFDEKQSLFAVLKFAQEHYQKNLDSENGKLIAASYLRERSLSVQTIRDFGLGYALDEWDNLKNNLAKNAYNEDFAEKVGLFSQKNERKFDRFRNRIMFPIHDVAGRVVGFGARAIKSEDQPKYLNSPESEVYHKSEVLYGLFQAKNEIRKKDLCFLTEGYLDVISLHQLGFKNTVASSGTSLTVQQVKLIRRFTENITVLYDGDTAGQKAALRAIDIVLEENMNVKILTFPQGEDPDSFARKNSPEQFEAFLEENQQDFIAFKTKILVAENPDSPILKNNAIKSILESVALIPDKLKMSLFLEQIAKNFGVDLEIIKNELQKILKKNEKSTQKIEKIPELTPEFVDKESKTVKFDNQILRQKISDLEKEIIRLLLFYGDINLPFGSKVYEYLFSELAEINYHNSLYNEILALYRQKIGEQIVIDAEFLKQYGSPDMVRLVADFEQKKYELSPNWSKWKIEIRKEAEHLPENLYRACLWLKYMTLKESLKENLTKIEKIGLENENWDETEKLLLVQMNLNKQIKEIGDLLGNVMSSPFFIP